MERTSANARATIGGALLLALLAAFGGWPSAPDRADSPAADSPAATSSTLGPARATRIPSIPSAPRIPPSPRGGQPEGAPPQDPLPGPGAPRGTTWVVLRVGPAGAREVVATVHKDELPYAAPPAETPVRFRLLDPSGDELRGPCPWPRLCECERETSHNTGCVRHHHSGSVRLRLPRLRGPSQVVIERRAGPGWTLLAKLELQA